MRKEMKDIIANGGNMGKEKKQLNSLGLGDFP